MLEFSWHETSQVKYFGYLIEWRECFPGRKLLSSLYYKPIEAAFQTFRPGVSESNPLPTCCFCIGAPWIKCKKRQRSFYVPHLLNSSRSNPHIPSFTLLLKSLSQSCHCEDKWSSPEPGTGTLHSWPPLFSPHFASQVSELLIVLFYHILPFFVHTASFVWMSSETCTPVKFHSTLSWVFSPLGSPGPQSYSQNLCCNDHITSFSFNNYLLLEA